MTRRPLTGPSSVPPPEAAPPSAVVPHPVSSRPAATVPTVSFRREALRMGSSCVSGGRPPLAGDGRNARGACHACVRIGRCGRCVHDVVVAQADRTVLASADPGLLGRPLDLGASRVLEGRSWVGDVEVHDGSAAVAMAPVYSARGDRVLGLVAVQRRYPGVLGSLQAAAPNLLTYLGLASALGIGGGLLVGPRGEGGAPAPGPGR